MASAPVETVFVQLAERGYEIRVTTGGLAGVGAFAREQLATVTGRAALPLAMIVTDRHVESPHAQQVRAGLEAAGFSTHCAVLDPGEATKCLASAMSLYDRLVAASADRRTLLVAVGGGVVGDLAGFVAATYARGIPYLQVPTTLLAQVDSSVGGKVAVNHLKSKNLIGCFYQPVGVLIDTEVLCTLPDREFRCGLAEVVKYGVILDAEFFAFLEKHVTQINARDAQVLRRIIAHCCRLKAGVVEQDEREETGLRAVLNYGHTFAHAFENLGNYQPLHGEAVAVGMVCASRLAEALGKIPAEVTDRQVRLLEALGLPTSLGLDAGEGVSGSSPSSLGQARVFDPEALMAAMKHDKKAVAGLPRFVLPLRIGEVEQVADVDMATVRKVLLAVPSP